MLKQGREQIRSHFDSLPGANRNAVIAFAIALLMGGLIFVTRSNAKPKSQALFGGRHLRQVEMDQVELAFSAAGLSEWDREGDQIMVPTVNRHLYLAAIQQASALPYTLQSSVERSLTDSSYFESDSARKQRHEFAKAKDLGAKIAAFGDIAWASVDYDEQAAHGFETKPIRSASVVVVSEDGRPLPTERLRMIQEFVRASYAGMSDQDVVITDTSTGRTPRGNPSRNPSLMLAESQRQTEPRAEDASPKVNRAMLGNGMSSNGMPGNALPASADLSIPEPLEADAAPGQTPDPLTQLLIVLGPIAILVVVGLCIMIAAFRMRMKTTANAQASLENLESEIALAVAPEQQTQDETNMREELADLIESNPELAAQIVHGWLADAA